MRIDLPLELWKSMLLRGRGVRGGKAKEEGIERRKQKVDVREFSSAAPLGG
jgi:hypothetical protein